MTVRRRRMTTADTTISDQKAQIRTAAFARRDAMPADEHVPATERDEKLDLVLTEREIIDLR